MPAVILSATFYGCAVLEKGIPPESEKPNGGSNQTNNFLNQTEKEGLIYIVEEEKLVRDLNGFFYDKWNLEIFVNTKKAARDNMNNVLSLISKYGIEWTEKREAISAQLEEIEKEKKAKEKEAAIANGTAKKRGRPRKHFNQ